ncbi:MAG: PadR family transcriptional regulator [Ktedonobacterales bacterium]
MRELKKGSLGMLALYLLRERPSYGYEICERLRVRSGGTLSFDEGAIYPLLHEYARRGLVISYLDSVDAEPPTAADVSAPGATAGARKGPPRRYYRITNQGRAALDAHVSEWRAFADAVGRVLGQDAPALANG